MKLLWTVSLLLVGMAIAGTLACSDRSKAPDVTGDIRHSLEQAGLNDVSVSQDRDKGVVRLTGKVRTEDDKARAESIARSVAGDQVVSNEIALRPRSDESTAKKVDSDLDSGIDKNLDAMLVQHRLKKDVRYDVNNGVVTLKGNVNSRDQRASVERLAEKVPNVKQVVNEIEVKHEKATSSK
jgi:hyperosmotically inducible protein